MAGGGGSQTVTQTNLPEYARPYFEDIMGRTMEMADRPYQAYDQPRVQDFNQDQNTAFNYIRNMQDPWQMQAAADYANKGATAFGTDQMNQYMSPYMQAVTDQAMQSQQRQSDIQSNKNNLAATKSNAFGGYRHGLIEAENQRNNQQAQNRIFTQGQQDAFSNAQQQFERDRGANFNAGQQMYGLGGLASAVEQQQIQRLLDIGTQQQQMGQRGLDVGYENFVNQRDYDRNNLAFLSSMLRGTTPGSVNSETVTTGGGNPYAQLAGGGLTLAALMGGQK